MSARSFALSALLAISRNCFFKVVLSIFEETELTGAIIPTATIPYAVAIYSSIFRYFFGSAVIATDCLARTDRRALAKPIWQRLIARVNARTRLCIYGSRLEFYCTVSTTHFCKKWRPEGREVARRKNQRRKLLMVSVIIAAKLRATAMTKVIVNSVLHMASAPSWRERGREVWWNQQTTQNRLQVLVCNVF